MSRPLFPRLDAPELPPQSVDELVEALLTLSADVQPRPSIARVWTPELAAVQCGDPYAVAQHLRIGGRSGLMTGRCMRTLAGDGAMVVLLEDILWGGLAEAERALLLDQFLSRARGRGAQLAVAPDLGYADLTPLRNARFRPNQRVLNAYLISFTGDPPPGPASAMYLKVF